MGKTVVEFEYGIGEEVAIRASGLVGRVEYLLVEETVLRYRVRYADRSGQVHEEYFRSTELRPAHEMEQSSPPAATK